MDSKSLKAQFKFPTDFVCELVKRESEKRDGNPFWGKPPEQVISEIITLSNDGEISFLLINKVLHNAKTSKMRGDANRGLEYINTYLRLLMSEKSTIKK